MTRATTARATSKATRTATTSRAHIRSQFRSSSRLRALAYQKRERISRVGALALISLAAISLALPAAANATDARLRTTLALWSHRIAVDAQGIGLSAARRHPRRMTLRARHFRLDALRARNALSGQARVHGLKTAAVAHARIAARYARRGGALLLAAKRLLG
jgi:hypothetical protein